MPPIFPNGLGTGGRFDGMGMSERSRKKHVDAAMKVAPPGSIVRGYAVGNMSARFSTGAAVAIGVFGSVFIIGLALGVIFYPGALLVLYINYSIRPPRGIASTDDAVLVLRRSFLNGRPSTLLGSVPSSALSGAQAVASKVHLTVDRETLILRRSEFDRLASAAVPVP
jgi:hypothetical protein